MSVSHRLFRYVSVCVSVGQAYYNNDVHVFIPTLILNTRNKSISEPSDRSEQCGLKKLPQIHSVGGRPFQSYTRIWKLFCI